MWSDGFKTGFPNPDQHIHMSCFSDDLTTSIGSYNPLREGALLPPSREVPSMNGFITKTGGPQCVATPVVIGRKRLVSLGADLGSAVMRAAVGTTGGKWKVYEPINVGGSIDPWTIWLPDDAVKVSFVFRSGDAAAAIGWSVIYV